MADQATDRAGHVYIDIARHAVKGPFRDSTRAAQTQCLLACTVFLLAWFNLVTVGEFEFGGAKLTASLQVVAGLALVYGFYQLVRFLSEATLELRLYRFEFDPIKTMAAEAVGEEMQAQDARAEAFRASLDAFDRKINDNRTFYDRREAEIAEITAAHRPRIDALKARIEAFNQVDAGTLTTAEATARSGEQADAYIDLEEAQEDLDALLKPIRERPYPHTDMSEGDGLISRSLRVYDMSTTEKTISAMKASRQRGIMVAVMDMALPVALFVVSVIVLLTVRPTALTSV